MSDLAGQKRLAASLLRCGMKRVWLDPERLSDIQNAVSREDLRGLISEGVIRVYPARSNSRGRARVRKAKRAYGHCRGPGRRCGAAGARHPGKREWIQRIRAIRKALATLREDGSLDRSLYRLLYRKASGGQFRSVAHLRAQIEIMSGRMK